MAIDVEVGRAAVSTSPYCVGKFAECWQIVSGVKRDAMFEGESFAVRD
jgi:hypothetical protein